MHLRTLGGLELSEGDFTQPQPLLLLAYLCSEGKTSRQTLSELFWSEQADPEKRSKSLHLVLKKLLALNVVCVTGNSVASTLPCDLQEFNEACSQGDRKALELYKGPFLYNVESNKRLHLSADAQTWLHEKREYLHEQWLELLLKFAETHRDQNHLKGAAVTAWQVFKESQKVSYPEEKTMWRVYGLLLETGQKRKAEKVKAEAEREYGVQWRPVAKPSESVKPFVGRDLERKEIRQLLGKGNHLVTLTGLGGVGKTELARVVTKDVRYQFARVAFVPLESLPSTTDEQTLLAKIAGGFGLELPARVTVETLAKALGHERGLLVLDNLEHVLHFKTIVGRLSQQASELSILVTSRETLDLEGERVVSLEGLAVPPNADANFTDFAATTLWLELCKAKGVDVASQKQEVLELCRAVGGLPLALHLAAPWAKVLPLADILTQLRRDLEFLSREVASKDQRHANIRSVLAMSLSRLTSVEQSDLQQFAVFEGRVSFASVNAILKVPLTRLKRFVTTSLLRFYPSEASYDLHPLVKQALRADVQSEGKTWAALKEKHAQYYLGQLALIDGKDEALKNETRQRLSKEAENVFAAWRFKIEQNDSSRLADLALGLTTFCDDTATCSEGVALLACSENTAPQNAWLGRFLACRAWLELRLGNTEKVRSLATRALTLLSPGDVPSLSRCYIALAAISDDAGEFEMARSAFASELALHDDTLGEAANARINLAIIHLQLGEFTNVETYLSEAEAYFTERGNVKRLVQIGFTRACLLTEQSDYFKARVLLERLLGEAREHNLHHRVIALEMQLARVFFELGEVARSEYMAKELLRQHPENRWLKAKMLLLLGDAKLQQEECATALQTYSEALATVIPTESIPALLLRLARLAKASLLGGERVLAGRLLGYCADANNYRRMSFSDRAFVNEMVKAHKEMLLKQHLPREWLALEPRDVAVLAISEVTFILAKTNQGETLPTLADNF
jgi:tetratricopeptide (TPR) repeat protein